MAKEPNETISARSLSNNSYAVSGSYPSLAIKIPL